MPRLNGRLPKNRCHKVSVQAIVTMDGKDNYIGAFGSPESKTDYKRVIREWLDRRQAPSSAVDDLLLRCDHLVLVSTTTVPAVSAAVRLAGRLPAVSGLVLRGSGGGVAPEEVAQVLGLPVLARMRDQRGLDEAIGLGLGPVRRRGPLVRAARAVATAVVPQARA